LMPATPLIGICKELKRFSPRATDWRACANSSQ
jgi:hypothetical protein